MLKERAQALGNTTPPGKMRTCGGDKQRAMGTPHPWEHAVEMSTKVWGCSKTWEQRRTTFNDTDM